MGLLLTELSLSGAIFQLRYVLSQETCFAMFVNHGL